MEAAVF